MWRKVLQCNLSPIFIKEYKMIEQVVANTVIDSFVESQRQSSLANGIQLGSDWSETQKSLWQNAIKSGQCTLDELKAMVFKKI